MSFIIESESSLSSATIETRVALASSRKSALRFLLDTQNPQGWWSDFPGNSDEWVTAFVAVTLALCNEPAPRAASLRAWHALRRRRWWIAGWGFNGTVPPDADSTTWALRLAESLQDHRHRRAQRASRFLLRHLRPDSGIATYASSGAIRAYTRLVNPRLAFDGWCQSHISVTAAAAHLTSLPVRDKLLAYLRDRQTSDGSWPSYWWCDREYSTALAASALSETSTADREHIQRAVNWACTRFKSNGAISTELHPEGSAFATALGLLIIAQSSHPQSQADVLIRGTTWLIATQQADGSWPGSARLRMPMPHIIDPDSFDGWLVKQEFGGDRIVYDQRRLFTTATVVEALNAVSELVQ